MKLRRPFAQLIFGVFMFVLASCGGGAQDGTEIQTVVAGTLQALTATEPAVVEQATAAPLASPLPPSAQTDQTNDAVAPNVEFEGISFNLDYQLATSWKYEITAPPDPASDNPFQSPSYYQLSFEGFVTDDPFREYPISWRQPRLYVIPVENMQSFPDGGYGLVQLSRLQQILASKPVAITDRMPVLPYSVSFDNGEVFHSNLQYLNFQNGSGVRFLAEYSQAAFPIGRAISYIYQGITSDSNYYISLTLPISQTALDQYNAPYDTSINDEASYQAFLANYESYLLGAVGILESTPGSNFTPDLAQLDAMVQSLNVKP